MNDPNDATSPNARDTPTVLNIPTVPSTPAVLTTPNVLSDPEVQRAGQEPKFRIRAAHTESTVTVYQAYRPKIGNAAARDGRFPSAWSRERMTWIKPSFLWMMYRCGWGTKEGQETVLAVEITREGFEWALRHACLSHYVPELHGDQAEWKRQLKQAPARVQWDPERDLHLDPLPYRSLQLGLAGEAAVRYADEWIVGIEDVTPLAKQVHAHVRAGELTRAAALLPAERPYPVAEETVARLRRQVPIPDERSGLPTERSGLPDERSGFSDGRG